MESFGGGCGLSLLQWLAPSRERKGRTVLGQDVEEPWISRKRSTVAAGGVGPEKRMFVFNYGFR